MPDLADINALLNESPAMLVAVAFVFGACIGSFLNVVIYRLPLMMERRWRAECFDYLALPADEPPPPLTLSRPASHCPHCKKAIPFYHNIPLVSYVLLKGKCGACGAAISRRYFWVELAAALLACLAAWKFGAGAQGLYAALLAFSLLTLTMIDLDHQLLPDSITLPTLWLGLLVNLQGMFVPLEDAVIGAAAGYLSLWAVFWLFKLLTGKTGMGYGDFKLLALLGAWLGWQALPGIVILGSLTASVIGIALIFARKRDRATPFPFGPYLAIAGLIALVWGGEFSQAYQRWLILPATSEHL